MNGTPLRFGLVGGGSIARYHVDGIRAAGGAEIRAVAASGVESAANAARALNIPQACVLPDLLARDDVEAVIVATPDDTHRAITIAAFDAGKHVLLQKPMALSPEDCVAILAAARRNGRMLLMSYMHRHFPEIEALRMLLADGALGPVMSARLRNATPGPDWGDWFFRRARSGGVVMQLGVHGIDLAQHLFGRIASVAAETALRRARRPLADGRIVEPDIDDHALALYRFESGVLLSHEMSYAEPAGTDRFALEVVGEEAVAHLRGARGALAVKRRGGDWEHPPMPPGDVGARQHRVAIAILAGRAPHDGSDIDGLADVLVAEAITESATTGQRVSVPRAADRIAGISS